MAKTKEQIAKYNKEYFARPEVIARAKIRNSQRREKRKLYKKTEKGKESEHRYRNKRYKSLDIQNKRLIERYGITVSDRDIMMVNQNGKCAICNKVLDKFHIDHCHKTNKVRGLLCSSCNMALGLFKDDILILENAKKYLYGRK
jgi:hypothetical protein